ncbi:glycerate kinase family protein [Marinilabilia rubra]|uniref:Glycerate kinase n=1 Tax=Marinilabilia rubra TaxID=2162893 RepID=A0A2U2BAM0_9BACT|nr:glycerate kinase [Marinilabilia rubra]PWE00114.1 glycerate kinase [Marinilabilia rubra]
MKILVAPDSFKGSISSIDAAKAIKKGLNNQDKTLFCDLFPLSDGGEGTLSTIQTFWKGDLIKETVIDALGSSVSAVRGSYNDGKVSVIELAQASGLGRLSEKLPLEASTYGTGLQIKNALETGAEEIILTLGGSATVDGGAGLFSALRVRLLDENGYDILQGSNPLCVFKQLDFSGLSDRFSRVKWTILADVDNPVFGRNGGIRTYGPQKGLSEKQIVELEQKMREWVNILTGQSDPEIVKIPGSGAAGAAALPFLAKGNALVENGFDWISKTFGLEKLIDDCDVVITGEGRLDYQTAMGKGPGKLASLARQKGKKTIAVVGRQEIETDLFDHVVSLQQFSNDASTLMARPALFLEKAGGDLVKLLNSF